MDNLNTPTPRTESKFELPGNELAVIGLTLAIITWVIIVSSYGLLSIFSFVTAVAGIIVGVIALKRGQHRKMTWIGLVANITGASLSLILIAVTVLAIAFGIQLLGGL
ncbi:hypothetical protein B7Z00_04360 [Candidatus Saccharibacteria bacterium 32-50-10]|nr:MAG: hypothetical protein B7Z00_04360 [Candidatus Saccharibacteria bacterium 32-50-10]